jgi:hypothetical protein
MALLSLTLAGCSEAPSLLVYHLESPAARGSAEPNIAVGPGGFYLSWLEPTERDTHTLRYARWDGDTWSEPTVVNDRPDLFVNWADFPSLIVLDDSTLAAHWLERTGTGPYAYGVRMAVTRDRGESWSEDIIPHRDRSETEHGFVSLFPLDGRIGAVWLDGRETPRGDPMTLRSTTIGTGGMPGDEALVDASVCDCCQTGAALAGETPVVVYRGRTDDEVRDIRVVRRIDGRWTEPTPVHRDGWVISACPVNGPAIDALESRVAVAWFTAAAPPAPEADSPGSAGQGERSAESETEHGHGAGDAGRVLVAYSDDGGATFGEPVRVDDGAALGRVDLELLTDGTALVTWLERTPDGAEVRFRTVHPSGDRGGSLPLATSSAARVSGFPRMAARGNRILFAYTEPTPDGSTRVRTLHAVLGRQESAP